MSLLQPPPVAGPSSSPSLRLIAGARAVRQGSLPPPQRATQPPDDLDSYSDSEPGSPCSNKEKPICTHQKLITRQALEAVSILGPDEARPRWWLHGLPKWKIRLIRLLPIASAFCWFGTLSVLLLCWALVDDYERYSSLAGSIPFVSDIGGVRIWLFYPGSVLTALGFYATYCVELVLRHERLLLSMQAGRKRWIWVLFSWADLALVTMFSIFLILLSVFNTYNYHPFHLAFTFLAITGFAGSAVVHIAQGWKIGWHKRRLRWIWASVLSKIVIWLLFGVAGVVYIVCAGMCTAATVSEYCWRIFDVGAVSEWILLYLAGVYILSLTLDLWPVEHYESLPPLANKPETDTARPLLAAEQVSSPFEGRSSSL